MTTTDNTDTETSTPAPLSSDSLFEQHIAPILNQLRTACQEHGFTMLNAVAFPPSEGQNVVMLNIVPNAEGLMPTSFQGAAEALGAPRAAHMHPDQPYIDPEIVQ